MTEWRRAERPASFHLCYTAPMPIFAFRSGNIFSYDESDVSCNVTLDDIVDSLDKETRFFNQSSFSVAQHSFALAKFVANVCIDKQDGEWDNMVAFALVHDFQEAVMRDVPSSMKSQEFRDKEELVRVKLLNELGLIVPYLSEQNKLEFLAYDAMFAYVEAELCGFSDVYVDRIEKEVPEQYLYPHLLVQATNQLGKLADGAWHRGNYLNKYKEMVTGYCSYVV